MIIRNAEVFTEEGIFEKKDIYIREGRFTAEEPEGGEEIDAAGCYAIPGLTDIHFHGCVGKDFCDGTEEAIQAIADYEASVGVTTICPATMTFAEDKLLEIARAANAHKNEKGAALCGINMEGPFIAMKKKGAQNGKYIHKPDIEMFERLQEAAGGLFKLVDLAPEEEGAMEFIRAKKDEVVLSIAHTTTDYDTAKAAIDAGVHHVTHLYNAMNPINHREPGPIIAASDDSCCEAELICDNVHIHPAVVRNTLKMFGTDRVIFISDTMMAAGLEDGMYELGGQPVIVKGNKATLEDGTIAGSNTNLMDCMRVAVQKMDVPLETAVRCAAVNSAKSIGIYDEYGSITPGKVANLVLLNKEDLATRQVILRGERL
ncbi:MAG: N-acetylglucosamine-6-phosphate deacetylase [Clostridiales bacterium]|nr:N-acetylglucosamine-6-phosphate deacetylase [Clostridiales bacterium]